MTNKEIFDKAAGIPFPEWERMAGEPVAVHFAMLSPTPRIVVEYADQSMVTLTADFHQVNVDPVDRYILLMRNVEAR